MSFEVKGSGITAQASDDGLRVGFAGYGDVRLFQRRAHRMSSDGSTEQIDTLVAELDGVRVYFRRDADGRLEAVITHLDLYP